MNSPELRHNRDDLKEHLIPPGGSGGPQKTGSRKLLLITVALFTLLLCGAVGVLFFLPVQKTQVVSAPEPVEESLSPVVKTAAVEAGGSEQPKRPLTAEAEAAKQAREQVWTLKIAAEAQHISDWGGAEYQQIRERLDEADSLLNDEAFQSASEYYQTILADLQILIDSKEQRYRDALSAGHKALMDEQPEAAAGYFNRALVIKPSGTEAQLGLEQAETLAELIAAYENALSLEEQGLLEEALAQLGEIGDPGSPYKPALEARKRIQNRLNELIFDHQMNSLYSALEAQNFSSAQSSLQTLKQLGVNRQEVDQAAALLAEKQTRAEIGRLKGRAEQFSGEEQWQQALEAYEAILRLDPNLLFATAGQVAAAKRAELDRSMSNAIDHPLRLQDEGQQSAAGSLLAYAQQVEPQGPRLRSQIEALDSLLKAVRTPVAVIIESDNLTDITIYHVGRIGPVFSRKIELKPGTYTVVGSRNGYRDVRKEIIIGADSNEYRYDIRCEEAI